jgi:ppGpp synthetase/RelA/SpoT-type nucleotidyltranferase
MKVGKSIRSLYDELFASQSILKAKVDQLLAGKKDPRWHYFSRLKELESFAQKLETGRIGEPKRPEDFFGCTLVVENQSSIPKAEKLIAETFNLVERRPKTSGETYHKPSSFEFDDLRLYCVFEQPPDGPPTGAEGLKFEVQIKTFLAHAWGIATHDLIYKGHEIDWMASRIAFQIKAMLEHAEISISSVRQIAELPEAKKEDRSTAERREMVKWIHERWKSEQLPTDVLRLADSLISVARAAAVQPEELRRWIDQATREGRGAQILNLSPYSTVVKEVLLKPEGIQGLKCPRRDKKTRLLVTEEMEVACQEHEIEQMLIRV